MDITQTARHGHALVSQAGNMFAWFITMRQSLEYSQTYNYPYTVVNVQNGAETFVP